MGELQPPRAVTASGEQEEPEEDRTPRLRGHGDSEPTAFRWPRCHCKRGTPEM